MATVQGTVLGSRHVLINETKVPVLVDLTFHWRKYYIVDSSEFCGEKRKQDKEVGRYWG